MAVKPATLYQTQVVQNVKRDSESRPTHFLGYYLFRVLNRATGIAATLLRSVLQADETTFVCSTFDAYCFYFSLHQIPVS